MIKKLSFLHFRALNLLCSDKDLPLLNPREFDLENIELLFLGQCTFGLRSPASQCCENHQTSTLQAPRNQSKNTSGYRTTNRCLMFFRQNCANFINSNQLAHRHLFKYLSLCRCCITVTYTFILNQHIIHMHTHRI